MPNDFFTADPHFGHARIIDHCRRPFGGLDEMHEALVSNWNSRVSKSDAVYVVGDMFLKMSGSDALALRARLSGNIYLVLGNHDKVALSIPQAFGWIKERYAGIIGGRHIVLDHYAGRVWRGSHSGSWQLYGHSHAKLPEDPSLLSFDVGVDAWNYFPVSFDEVAAKMARKLEAREARRS